MKAINKLFVNLNKCFIKFNEEMKKILLMLVVISTCLCSCNVTRVMTNESQYFQRGDTAVVIQTKTTETYNAEKKVF